MSTDRPAETAADTSTLTYGRASRLLRLAMTEDQEAPLTPVDAVVARLRQPDAADWLATVFDTLAKHAGGPVQTELLTPTAPLPRLTSLKDTCTRLAADTDDPDSLLAGTLGYLLCVAAALAHHGVLITGRDRAELDAALLSLRELLRAPWPDLVGQALGPPHAPTDPPPH